MGFKINTYIQFIANKEINGKQSTIFLYVDGLKVLHMDKEIVRNILKLIE